MYDIRQELKAGEPVNPVPADLLANAIMVGARAYAGRDRMAPLMGQYAPSLWIDCGDGPELLTVTDHPLNRFALAILDAYPFNRDIGRALLFRAFLFQEVLRDKRAGAYQREDDDPLMIDVDEALVDAVARVPHRLMRDPDLDEVFRLAAGQPSLPLGAPVRCEESEHGALSTSPETAGNGD